MPWRYDEISVEHASFDEAVPFMQAHYAAIFEMESRVSRFVADPMTEAKTRFCREMDVFLFRDGRERVGVLMSHPLDWSTYYIRSAAFLPSYRGRNLMFRFLREIEAPLRAVGVERVEAECAPGNAVVMRLLTGVGFGVTAMTNSDRFGAMVRFTRFLREEAQTVFQRQFCAMSTRPPNTMLEERRTQ